MGKIKIAIAGVGNCASSLLQGLVYYKDVKENDTLVPGLMHNVISGYRVSDIEPVAAFDVDPRKIGKDLSEAIFSEPNCTKVFCKDIPKFNVEVMKGPVMDGVSPHMLDYPDKSRTFVIDDTEPVNVAEVLKDTGAEILINYLPVGSEKAVRHYAEQALKAGCAFVNCMPVFIASDQKWSRRFEEKKLPIVGDDIKSQVGATILHRTLSKLLGDRGVKITRTYQLNVGGNTDFLNMKEMTRLKSKKISKTEAVQSVMPQRLKGENIHIGPSDYVPWLKDNKLAFMRLEGRKFGDAPVSIEVRLSVEDSPNSAGCVIDIIRCCKLALDRNVSGPLTSISAYTMKHPPEQYTDTEAKRMVNEFIEGDRER
jgi:myo-inositol-1-phosphate synthase